MKADVITEPSLEFAGGARHLDPRFGVVEYGPADLTTAGAPRTINVGLLGAQADIDAARAWLEESRQRIEGKNEIRPGLWPAWPGFTTSVGYRSELVLEERLQRPIKTRALAKLDGLAPRKRIDAAVDLFVDELQTLVQDGRPHVVVCCIPDSLVDLDAPPRVPEIDAPDVVDTETAESARPHAFHDLLKARAMPLRVPLQLIRASTYDPTRAGRQKRRTWKTKQRQDPASIAWNFFTALYYKGGGTPWRMVRASTDLDTCFVGVTFFRTADGKETATSVAQVYNQRGDGVVVRGGPAYRSNEDRQLHLSETDAHAVARDAMLTYRGEHRHLPARIIVQKTSPFDQYEREGMLRAADNLGLDACELVWVTNPTTRLYREGYHPPRRGTYLELAADHGVLYTRGSVEWYETYAGMYVPRPIALRAAHIERNLWDVAEETLALSKMNWNSTRFDGRLPVTLRTARQVADIIKHLAPNDPVEPNYGYYM
jgi:hypothetical protein